jgi:hypothetical protein
LAARDAAISFETWDREAPARFYRLAFGFSTSFTFPPIIIIIT